MTADSTQVQGEEPSAFWGPLSLAIPLVSVVLAFLIVASGSKGVGGDMVGFGFLIYGVVGVGAASIFGVIAAYIAMKREERWIASAIVGFLLNLAFTLIGAFVLIRILK